MKLSNCLLWLTITTFWYTATMANTTGMTDREAVIDAAVRFAISLDDANTELLSSTISDNVIMELPGSNERVEGRGAVTERLMSAVGIPLDTTHMTSNFQVTIDGDPAHLSCYALAQHFRRGEGLSTAVVKDYYLMGNRWRTRLVRNEQIWRIEYFGLSSMWTQGDREVMNVG